MFIKSKPIQIRFLTLIVLTLSGILVLQSRTLPQSGLVSIRCTWLDFLFYFTFISYFLICLTTQKALKWAQLIFITSESNCFPLFISALWYEQKSFIKQTVTQTFAEEGMIDHDSFKQNKKGFWLNEYSSVVMCWKLAVVRKHYLQKKEKDCLIVRNKGLGNIFGTRSIFQNTFPSKFLCSFKYWQFLHSKK
jgi:hypothetical protein